MLKEKNKYEKEKGITLVALVITVVVMLILAAVAIGSVTGDGLFSKTRQAAETYENASRTEGEQIQTLMNEIDEYLTENNVNEGVDPEEIAIVGDFVNYSVKVDSNGNDVIDEGETYDKWRILDFDNNGHMEIVCYNGPEFTLGAGTGTASDSTEEKEKAKSDYVNAIKILNEESIPYKEGTYGESARHLGSDPSDPSNYDEIDESYIKFYEDYNNIESNANYGYINQTHHESDLAAVQSFSNTAEGKKLAGASNLEDSWLASRRVSAWSNRSGFCVRVVSSSGWLQSRELYCVYSFGRRDGTGHSSALAPVVILESGVKIIEGSGDGSEDSPWQLAK